MHTELILAELTAKLRELERDKQRLDWLQAGHCVICLCKFDKETKVGIEFEIDGNQDAPRHENVRKAIDIAMAEQETT